MDVPFSELLEKGLLIWLSVLLAVYGMTRLLIDGDTRVGLFVIVLSVLVAISREVFKERRK